VERDSVFSRPEVFEEWPRIDLTAYWKIQGDIGIFGRQQRIGVAAEVFENALRALLDLAGTERLALGNQLLAQALLVGNI
jgi:hypothetical protein